MMLWHISSSNLRLIVDILTKQLFWSRVSSILVATEATDKIAWSHQLSQMAVWQDLTKDNLHERESLKF